MRACRKLNLDGSSPVCNKLKSKTVDKDCHQQSAPRRSRIQPQSDDLDSSIENISPVNRCLSSEDRRAKTRLRRFYSRNYENRQTSVSTNTSNTVNSNHEDMPTRTPKKLAVSRKILQTPSKSLDVEENCVHNELLSSDDVNSIIESTPIKRGKESPEPNRSGILGGPLSECLSYCMSPSSSPRIPLYYDNSYTNYSYQNESRTNGEENSADSDWLSISDWLPCTPLKSCHSSVESFDVVISNYSADSSDVYLKETSVEKPCLTVLNQKTSEFQKTRDQHIKHSLVRSESKNTVFTIHQKLQNSHVHQRPAFFI